MSYSTSFSMSYSSLLPTQRKLHEELHEEVAIDFIQFHQMTQLTVACRPLLFRRVKAALLSSSSYSTSFSLSYFSMLAPQRKLRGLAEVEVA
jgi:hypothetical protein